MIAFNGVSIDSVAPVMIEDIKVSPIQYNPVVRPRAVQFGAEFVRMGGGERTVTISLAILDKNITTRQAAFVALAAWARSDAEYRLELPNNPEKCLYCVCTAKPEPSTRAWWENKLRIVFTCYDNPFWTAKGERAVACGTQFTAAGNAVPLMQIRNTFASSASNVRYSNGSQAMTFDTIPAGDMVIDLNRQTAAVGNTSIMQYYRPAGSFVKPQTGTQTITGTGTVYFRERWE